MTDDFTTEAFHYLLDELDPERRAAFAERLARDPVAAEAFKQVSDQFAAFAVEAAPAPVIAETARNAEISAILAAVDEPAAVIPPRARPLSPFPHWVWPVAAAVLLGLNLAQFFFFASTGRFGHPSLAGANDPEGNPLSPGTRNGVHTSHEGHTPGPSSRPDAGISSDAREGAGPPARLAALQREYQELKRARDSLNQEYDHAILAITRRALAEQGVNRIAAMELVDVNSFARGDRKGLASLARDLLTQPGVVTPERPGSGPNDGLVASGGDTGPAGDPPYAWSVFDEKDNQGYLNLYNLPQVAADQTLQVWVKPVDSQDFQSVGEVPPQFYGKSGAVSYSLPAGTPTPVEIMITFEPRAPTAPTKPSGNVVLRGP